MWLKLMVVLLIAENVFAGVEQIGSGQRSYDYYNFSDSTGNAFMVEINKDILISCALKVSYQVIPLNENAVWVTRFAVDMRDQTTALECKDPGATIKVAKRDFGNFIEVIIPQGSGIAHIKAVQ